MISRINILVAASEKDLMDLKADIFADSIRNRSDLQLLGDRVVLFEEVDDYLNDISGSSGCALILVGPQKETSDWANLFLNQRKDLVVLQSDKVRDHVYLGIRDPGLEAILAALKDLCENIGLRVKIAPANHDVFAFSHRPLLRAAIRWIHTVIRRAVCQVSEENGDARGFSLTRNTLLQLLDASRNSGDSHHESDAILQCALAELDAKTDPLMAAYRAFDFNILEFKLMLLSLAPELDISYQRCIGYLQDDMSRRVGSLSLYCSLLGPAPSIRSELADNGDLWRQFVLDNQIVSADDPLRFDPFLAQWLLGEKQALREEPRVRRAMRIQAWPGTSILQNAVDLSSAMRLFEKVASWRDEGENRSSDCHRDASWTIFSGEDSAGWRALLELGAEQLRENLIRVEPKRFASADSIEIEDIAKQISRLARLTGEVVVIDATGLDEPQMTSFTQHFLPCLNKVGRPAAVICRESTRITRRLEAVDFEVVSDQPISQIGRVSAVKIAAEMAGVSLTNGEARELSLRFPLAVDEIEHAMRLAASREAGAQDARTRFIAACREIANQGTSHLADRLEPAFRMTDVVLPLDRKRQLNEIVEHVRLAEKVLDGWKFRDQLPFGRGVTAMFFGPSGTGKTIAAMAIANELGTELLRVDLSRVVSKYIGDTEKNIDRIFIDAKESGSPILFDEAEALLGKRSEVKDAHDRYANIEVAYVLQRMEAHDGLVILTTNMRQNIDTAFLRRLRFIIEFPRPDVGAREQIWRFCLPKESHDLNDNAFRQLSRKIDLTGGHIRQITLRAAFIAAAAGTRITLAHIVDASRAEFAKLGLPPVDFDSVIDRSAA